MTYEEWSLLTLIRGRIEGLASGVSNENVQSFLFSTAELLGEVLDKAQERGLEK